MKKQLVILVLIILFAGVILAGCSTQNNNENQIHNTINPENSSQNDNEDQVNNTIDSENSTQNDNETPVNNLSNPEKTKFIGTWVNASYNLIINLFSDETCIYVGNSGTWDVKDDKLSIELPDPYSITADYVFSNNNRTLSLTSQYGITTIYDKQ